MKTCHILTIAASAALFAGCAQYSERIGAAEQISFNQLPPAAQATVRNEVGNQPIAAITREYKYGDAAYRIEVDRSGLNPSLWVAQDGSIIKESRSLAYSSQQQYTQPTVQMNEAAGAQPQPQPSHKPRPLPTGKNGSNY